MADNYHSNRITNNLNGEMENENQQNQDEQRDLINPDMEKPVKPYKKCLNKLCKVDYIILVTISGILSTPGIVALALTLTTKPQKTITYERIGHFSCPDVPGTSLVYTGFTAGFPSTLGDTTYKCMPREPEDIDYLPDDQSHFDNDSEIYFLKAVEYRTFDENKHFNDVPCATCSIEGRMQFKSCQLPIIVRTLPGL